MTKSRRLIRELGDYNKGAGLIKVGDKIGNWTVVEQDWEKRKLTQQRWWVVRCICGKIKSVAQKPLRGFVKNGRGSASCGGPGCRLCRTHSQSKTNLYRIWAGMKSRCFSTQNKHYQNYGGRGISVCERWLDFANFALDMGQRPSILHSLERKDNDASYNPDNCIWATRREQQLNRRTNRLLTHNGVTMSLSEWAIKLGMRPVLLSQRYSRGMVAKDVLHPGELPWNPKRKLREGFRK